MSDSSSSIDYSVAVAVVVVADPEVDPGQEESQYPHCPVAWCDP